MTQITGMNADLVSLRARVPAQGSKNREAEEDQDLGCKQKGNKLETSHGHFLIFAVSDRLLERVGEKVSVKGRKPKADSAKIPGPDDWACGQADDDDCKVTQQKAKAKNHGNGYRGGHEGRNNGGRRICRRKSHRACEVSVER